MQVPSKKIETIRRPVVQVIGALANSQLSPEEKSDIAIQKILSWLSEKQKIPLPPEAFKKEAFELDISQSHPVSAISGDEYWSVQFDKPDIRIPGRTWRTEATVLHDKDKKIAMAGIRLAVIDPNQTESHAISVPSIIPDLISSPGLTDYGFPITSSPIQVSLSEEIEKLIELLKNPNRTRPVLILTNSTKYDATTDATLAAKKLCGLAHVFIIKKEANWALTEHLGKELSVWGGSIRTYWPNFDPSVDEAFKHKLATRDWLNRRFTKYDDFLSTLFQSFAFSTVRHGNLEDTLPSFRAIKQFAITNQLKSLNSGQISPREVLLEKEIIILKERLVEKESEYDYADEEVKKAEEERDRYRASNLALKKQVDNLTSKLSSQEQKISYPENLNKINDWCMSNFPGKITLLPRAAKAAEKSPFSEPELVYKCIEKLATCYIKTRCQGGDPKKIFTPIGVHLERTGDIELLKQWEDEYYVTYKGRKTCLEWHLKRGADKNETNTMRIYFFYDEDDEQVVIGYLPGHLTNSKS